MVFVTSHTKIIPPPKRGWSNDRDICNGFKHKKLSKPTYDADFNIYREYDHIFVETPESTNPIIYNIAFSYQDDIKKYELFDFIDKCYNIWEEFLRNKKMLTNQ